MSLKWTKATIQDWNNTHKKVNSDNNFTAHSEPPDKEEYHLWQLETYFDPNYPGDAHNLSVGAVIRFAYPDDIYYYKVIGEDSRHLVKEGNTIGWKKDPTEEDYILTYEEPDTIRWKQGPEERPVLTKDGGLVGWRDLKPKETFPGELMTEQLVNEVIVNHGWGNLPTGYGGMVLYTEGFPVAVVWNPTTETFVYDSSQYGGQAYAKFGVDVHLEIEFVVGDGPSPEMIYKGDVPAGTEVNIAAFSLDNFYNIRVSGPGISLNRNHFYEGIIEVRATKL